MPPKFDPNDPAIAELISLFKSSGISEVKTLEAVRNPKTSASLKQLVLDNQFNDKPLDDKSAGLLASLANQGSKLGDDERNYIARAIAQGRLKATDQLSAAISYLEINLTPVDDRAFDTECGVGFSITANELKVAVSDFISRQPTASWATMNQLLTAARQTANLKWAPSLDVKNLIEATLTERFGPKPAPAPKAKGKAIPTPSGPTLVEDKAAAGDIPPIDISTEVDRKAVFEEGFLGKLHKVGHNPQKHEYRRQEHLAWTKGNVFTRFPPEPNGFLHIGHSKAIFVNFGYAAHHNGHCYLRYDDTNPEAEEGRYFESILEAVRWLGFEPYRITYSSDHFQRLYDLAVELTRRDLAYVCHCTADELKVMRGGEERGPRVACKHRTRPVEESLVEFERMKGGGYKPGEATLRMKQDLEDGNPQMWDLVAYRVLESPHHRTGDKWLIYPTYDFTHCLCDSFENITHSLCTTEFVQSRVSYEWLCDALDLYKPRQSEYGRLSIEGTITSKRKLLKLVQLGHVMDWDDPRLYTLVALRRRGVPPGAIISFVGGLGVSTAGTVIQISRFEHTVRQYLEHTVPRLFLVLNPLKVTIENLPEDYVTFIDKPLHPKVPELGTSVIPFTRTIYIDADDFRLQDSKDYFRLAPGKSVGLFQAPYPITYVSHKTNDNGKVIEVIVKLQNDGKAKKPKTFVQWVAEHPPSGSPVRVDDVRIFHRLFKSDNPAAQPNYLDDIAPNSLEVVKGAIIEVGFWPLAKKSYIQARKESKERTQKAKHEADNAVISTPEEVSHDDTPRATEDQLIGNEVVRFQALRVGYFALDKGAKLGCLNQGEDVAPTISPNDTIVLNRIVSLKEDSGKAVS